MNNLLFLFFYLILYICGYGIVHALKNSSQFNSDLNKNFLSSKNIFHCLYPIVALFILGNLNLILNFFMPVKTSILFILIIFLILFILSLSLVVKNKYENFQLSTQIVFPLILSVSSYGIQFHYDAGAYHLGYQSWIYSEKIVFGLANINPYFSYGSINEYLYSIFSYFDINLLYFFVDLVFFVSFFGFMFDLLKQSENLFLRNSALIIFIYTILDNFGYKGGGNGSLQIQMVGKPDTAVGVLWIIVSLFVLNDLIQKNLSNFNFFIILLFSLFAFELKANAGPLIFLVILYFLKLEKGTPVLKLPNLFLYFLSFIYLLKNFIISGCLIYPIVGSCIRNVSWLNYKHIEDSAVQLLSLNKAISFNQDFLFTFNEFINHQYNKQIYINLLGSLVFVYIFKKVIFYEVKENREIKIYFSIFIILNYILFFSTVPAFRNGFGLFTTTFLLLSIGNLKTKTFFNLVLDKRIVLFLVFFSLILFPRFFMYTNAIDNSFQFSDYYKKTQSYSTFVDDFVIPIESNQCWTIKNCLLQTPENNKFNVYEKNGYKFIESFK